MRKNWGRTCRYEVKCRKEIWLQAREAVWSNSKRSQSSESRFSLCKKYELPLWLFVSGHVGGPIPCNVIKLADVPEMDYFANNNQGEVGCPLLSFVWFQHHLLHFNLQSLYAIFDTISRTKRALPYPARMHGCRQEVPAVFESLVQQPRVREIFEQHIEGSVADNVLEFRSLHHKRRQVKMHT